MNRGGWTYSLDLYGAVGNPPRIQGPVLYEAGAILAVSAYVVDCSNFITAAHRYRGSGAGSSMSL